MGRVGLGDDQQTRRILVDAVDNAGARHPADPGQAAGAVVEESVDQRPIEIARSRVDNKASWFVDNEQMIIFEDNIEGDVLRCGRSGCGFGDPDRHHLGPGNFL